MFAVSPRLRFLILEKEDLEREELVRRLSAILRPARGGWFQHDAPCPSESVTSDIWGWSGLAQVHGACGGLGRLDNLLAPELADWTPSTREARERGFMQIQR